MCKQMRVKFLPAIFLWLNLFAFSVEATNFVSPDVRAFWKNFKSAIAKKDKTALSAMTKFPLSMPYGAATVKTKANFLKRYNEIFKGDADAAKCFPKGKLEKINSKSYIVACGFKRTPNDEENKPYVYYFELTGAGWKFAGFDNINE